MLNTLAPRIALLALLSLATAVAQFAYSDVIRVTYNLSGSKFEIRNTPFGAGDGSFEVGPGNLVIDYPVSGNQLVDGGAQLRSYALLLQFTSGTTGLQISTDLTTSANFSQSQTFAQGNLSSGVITWSQSFPYKAQGSNTCNGGFCGFAGFQDGVPQVIDAEDPFTFAPFRFAAGGPQAGAGFVADEVQVPGNDSADTFLILKGTEASRVRIDTTPPEIQLLGDASVLVDCGSEYVDAGATASDNFSITAQVTIGGDVVDTGTPGIYVLTYNVADSAGNPAAEVTRTVTVADNCFVEEGAVDGEGALEGIAEGTTEGIAEGIVEGVVEGATEGVVEGVQEGVIEGSPEGILEGTLEGVSEGEGVVEGEGTAEGEGIAEGIVEGSIEGQVEGEGVSEGVLEGEGVAEGEGAAEGEGMSEGEGIVEGTEDGEGVAEGEGTVEGEGAEEGEGASSDAHSGDTNGDNIMDLSEVLRVIQIYNAGHFRCEAGTEDGFGIGDGDRTCQPHSADFISQDWMIDLSELLRVIQLYNFRGYRICIESDDGFCAPN